MVAVVSPQKRIIVVQDVTAVNLFFFIMVKRTILIGIVLFLPVSLQLLRIVY